MPISDRAYAAVGMGSGRNAFGTTTFDPGAEPQQCCTLTGLPSATATPRKDG